MTTVEEIPTTAIALVVPENVEVETKTSILQAFQVSFEEAEKWRQQALSLKVTDVTQLREMRVAREMRLALRDLRLNVEKTHKHLKEDSLRKGKALDGIKNVFLWHVQPIEKYLLEQEEFAERKAADDRNSLMLTRFGLIQAYGAEIKCEALADMGQEVFDGVLANAKAAHEKRQAEAAQAELDRAAKAKADAEERGRIQAENLRLKEEAQQREKEAKADRDRLEAERRLADAERKAAQDEANAKIKAAKDAADKLVEEERAKARAEREAREALEREAAQRRLDQEKIESDRRYAAEILAAGPDREKLLDLANTVRLLPVPSMSTERGRQSAVAIQVQLGKLSDWIVKQANWQTKP